MDLELELDQELVDMIIERYCAVLSENASIVNGIPESRLPCDARLVKSAIKKRLTQIPDTSDDYRRLRLAYSRLGLFIPDDQAHRCALAEQALMSMDPTAEGFKYVAEQTEVLKKIQGDVYQLTSELNDFLGKPPMMEAEEEW